MSGLAGRVLSTLAELEALAPRWWELWRRCPTATPFQCPAWLVPWWRHFAPGDLLVMAVERSDTLVGLAPFYREDGPWGRRLLPLGISVSDYHDVLLAPDDERAAWEVVLDLAGRDLDWDLWEFEELMPGATAMSLPCPADWQEQTAAQSACPTLVLGPGGFADSVPKAKRRQLTLAHNRAARRGAVALRQADPASIGGALDHLFRLHGARWQRRGETGVLADDPVQGFHRAAAPGLHDAGLLRLHTLAIEGEVVAAYYGFQHRERAYFYQSGFDPGYEFESPGTLIVAHAMEQAVGEGAREFHFLRGQESYKYGWGAVDRWNRRRSFRRAGAQHVVA
jgi:CelD/BcsL family acetyltransferase involved in cellulose biosynthesis